MARKIFFIPGKHSPFVQLVLFCLASGVLFYSITGRSFVSDDFVVMKRVGMDKVIWIQGFFRPLSDITLYLNYLLGGFHPAGYYWFNILVHGVDSFLLFLFCCKWKWTEEEGLQRKYAFIAALLFLTYPFHNEGIAWLLGRGASMAALFALAALLVLVSDLPVGKKLLWACLLYFAGLTAYESILLLPLMVFIILWARKIPMRRCVEWGMAMAGTLLAHLAIRIAVSGSITGPYGNVFFGSALLQYAGNLFKVTGRLFLPPVEDSHRMLLLFLLVMAGVAGVLFLFLKRNRQQAVVKRYFFTLFLLLAVSCTAPVLSAVSTRTSEGDRLLYFPSLFLCCGVSFLLVNCVKGKRWLSWAVVVLLAYNIFFLEQNNRNWVKASDITREILGVIGHQDPAKKVFVVNLPDELDGAFIFRQGLPEALLMDGMEPSRLVIVNGLKRESWLALPDSISVERRGRGVRIAPEVTITPTGVDSLQIRGTDLWQGLVTSPVRKETQMAGKNDIILYWNKKRLVRLEPLVR